MTNSTEANYYDYSSFPLDYNDFNDTMPPISLCEQEELHKFLSSYIPTVFYMLFCISVTGNILILIILTKWEKLNTVTNIFILNLVISDLLFSITLPFMAVHHSFYWIFGNIMCKVTTAFYFTGFQSFIIFLTLMTLDQYLTIVHSWSSTSRLRIKYSVNVSIICWSIGIIFSIPDIILSSAWNDDSGEIKCDTYQGEQSSWWISIGHYKHFVLFFLVPLFVIIICYIGILIRLNTCNIRRKERVLKLIFFLAFLFFLCWTPYNIIMFLMFQENIESFTKCHSILHYVFYICQTIVYFHCCMNPLLYAFLGTKFRRHLNCSLAKYCLPKRKTQQQDISLKTSMLMAFEK
ncbi:C-C chemokine receptor type 5-like [Rhinophrynus dorsalis]